MSSEAIETVLRRGLEDGLFPSASFLVAEKDDVLALGAIGDAVVDPKTIPATTETIYDLASLTKPLATGLLAAILISRKELRLNHRISGFFPDFKSTPYVDVEIEDLATHRAGFPAWKPFYAFADNSIGSKLSVLRQITREKPAYQPGTDVIYSDFGFILLGLIIEKVVGLDLQGAFDELVRSQLNIDYPRFNPDIEHKDVFAASEKGNQYEFQTCQELFPDHSFDEGDFRQDVIWGEVHDGNCHYLDGNSGHAGLFGDSKSTLRLSLQFMKETTELLDSETTGLFRNNVTAFSELSRSFAFQTGTSKGSTAEKILAHNAFGHLGFSGTMLWIEPDLCRTYILLTNRTHNTGLPLPDQAKVRKDFLKAAKKEFG